MTPHRYRSPMEDSHRWLDFPIRDDDIVISTRSKHGTTWMQMICASSRPTATPATRPPKR